MKKLSFFFIFMFFLFWKFLNFPLICYASINNDGSIDGLSNIGTCYRNTNNYGKRLFTWNITSPNVYIFFYGSTNDNVRLAYVTSLENYNNGGVSIIGTCSVSGIITRGISSNFNGSGNNFGTYRNIRYNINETNTGAYGGLYYDSDLFIQATSIQSAIDIILSDEFGKSDDLGYLKNVGYHVDSYGLENNPIGTNELVSWASESTTGIDLTQDKYQVEFALRDTSTHVDKNMYDSFLSSLPDVGLSAGPVSVSAWGLTDFIGVSGKYFISFFAPSGSDDQAYLRGQAVRSSLYGKTASVGTFSAKNLKASLNGIGVYKNYFRDYPESSTMKSYIDSIGSSPTRSDFYNNAFNYFKDFGADTYLSYDIMARIIDTSNGNKGDWLVINKHNTPYISSDSENRLVNGVTLQPSIINNFNPTVNNFSDTPDITINPDIDFRPIIKVGYVKAQPDVNIEEGDIITINNNYEYDFEGDSIVNDIDKITNITNIYEDNSGDGGGSGDVSDTKTDLGGIKQGLIIARKFIRSLVGWFRKIFNPFLPIWAQNVVIIALPITTIGIIWKMIKPLLQFLGRDVLPLLLEFFGGIPRLPG